MPKMPDQYKLNLLIRTTIIAINQANKTGNYTVLRDLAAPDFQNVNSAEKLAEIFTGLRNSKFDLSPVLFFDPKLIRQPELLSNGMLRLTGFFDTRPQRVNFDLIFQPVETDWRLYAVNVGTKEAPPATASTGGIAAPAQATPAATSGSQNHDEQMRSTDDITDGVPPGPFSWKPHGFIGGGSAGYNLQFDSIVVGVEGDLGFI